MTNGAGSKTAEAKQTSPVVEVLKVAPALVAALFSYYASENAKVAGSKAEEAKTAIELAKVDISKRSQQADLEIKAYEFVEKTLALKPDERVARGRAAAAIVNALTNPPLRDQLQNALRAGIKDEALATDLDNAAQFDLETLPGTRPVKQSDARTNGRDSLATALLVDALIPPVSAQSSADVLKSFYIDLFYCEGSSRAMTDSRRARANQAREKLTTVTAAGRVRVRLLPTLVQVRPGYQSFSDEIRFNNEGNEKEAATQLARVVGIEAPEVHRIDFKTPNYISVFYCAAQ